MPRRCKKSWALARQFIRLEEIQSGEGAARRLYPQESEALECITKVING
ncbi:hypothetical protein [Citrobacter freundii]|nr:hypothetical protein [Citrobacter freundii]